ncbi:prolyl oligopeptidase family serine peptidase [Marinilabiliaceae bacterium ANBcel2]|nr:prolyl oligopeptidase family serine peptidase [Marinilabiliaceae bacterium ANBcel2]
MISFSFKSFIALFLFSCMLLSGYAQQQGNVVEYFGRDEIPEIEEGELFHLFDEGFVLKDGVKRDALHGLYDIAGYLLTKKSVLRPVEGEFVTTPGGDSFEWVKSSVDEEQRFSDDIMRNSYLLTSFESKREEVVLLKARGHNTVYINGKPYEGDFYNFGYTIIPFTLKQGINEFIFSPGRFGFVSAALLNPVKSLQFTKRDITLPDIIKEEEGEKWGAVRIINSSEADATNYSIRCVLENGEESLYKTDAVPGFSARKVKFRIPAANIEYDSDQIEANLFLIDEHGREIDDITIEIAYRSKMEHHERTFISNIDGSVQYYSIAPSTNNRADQAMVLSVHGASVEARNQARAYEQKDWAHIVAPTNRRPFGFNWEEWGAKDAMEVLIEAENVFNTDKSRTYLTGHSMGGHGTWYLGATYPDRFAAIAPCASYPDILGYGARRQSEQFVYDSDSHMNKILRAANAGRVLELKRNFLQSGIYILHGDEDTVVPVDLAREMREVLGGFHNNFCYYEYPGGSHWYGDHSVDWFPIFDYFEWHSVPETNEVDKIEFTTASPAVSSSNYWAVIEQQKHSYLFSSLNLQIDGDTIKGESDNIRVLKLKLSQTDVGSNPFISIDNSELSITYKEDIILKKENDQWILIDALNSNQKYSKRHGGFKHAFDNEMVFVYATGGSVEENEWYRQKALFDAGTFLYRGNGSIDVISDDQFDVERYRDRNVIIYGNSDNNSVWNQLLSHSPVQIKSGLVDFGDREYSGDNLGALFVFPKYNHDSASVGVVAGTGIKGMRSVANNSYFSGVTGYPDILIFSDEVLYNGSESIKVSGFFGYDWGIENGDFIIK